MGRKKSLLLSKISNLSNKLIDKYKLIGNKAPSFLQAFRRIPFLFQKEIYISSTAFLGKNLSISLRYKNDPKGMIQIGPKTRIEDFCVIHAFSGKIYVGQYTFIGPHCVLYGHGNIFIGQNCLIATHTRIISSNHTIAPKHTLIRMMPDVKKKIIIEDDVWMGAGVTILAGIRVGKGAIIGAGSVVTKDVPPYSISVGNPAKVVRYRNEE
jgi:acetyltransferase-like isoleucine patch superfamily enzyme